MDKPTVSKSYQKDNRKPKKYGKPKKTFEKGYSLNKEYKYSDKNLPDFQPESLEAVEKSLLSEEKSKVKGEDVLRKGPKGKNIVHEEQKEPSKTDVPRPKQAKDSKFLNIQQSVVDAFKMTVEKSVRAKLYLKDTVAEQISGVFVRSANIQADFLDTSRRGLYLEAGCVLAVVSQIVSTLHPDQKLSFEGFAKLSSTDLQLPSDLCTLIKTIGGLNCEYGHFELTYPLKNCLNMLYKIYRKFHAEGTYTMVEAFNRENSVMVPWNEEGFNFLRAEVTKVISTEFSRKVFGMTMNPTLPGPNLTRVEYRRIAEAWPIVEQRNNLLALADLYYVNEAQFVDRHEVGGVSLEFINSGKFKLIRKWVSLVGRDYREVAQADFVKLFNTEKFVSSSGGTASQLVLKSGREVTSTYFLPPKDVTMGAMINPTEEIKKMCDFGGLIAVDMDDQKFLTVQDSYVRLQRKD